MDSSDRIKKVKGTSERKGTGLAVPLEHYQLIGFSRWGTAFPTHCDEIRQESRTSGPKGLDSVVVFGTANACCGKAPVPFRSLVPFAFFNGLNI